MTPWVAFGVGVIVGAIAVAVVGGGALLAKAGKGFVHLWWR